MIKQAEIQKLAGKDGVRDAQTEKDYILSWILTGISHAEDLRAALAFKGGTVLKKFYFDDYRFSEDLDFTLLNDTLNNSAIRELFDAAFRYVKEEANIDLGVDEFSEHETETINFYISYSGPLGGSGANKKVKVDISKSEILVFALEERQMIKRYWQSLAAHMLFGKSGVVVHFCHNRARPHRLHSIVVLHLMSTAIIQ